MVIFELRISIYSFIIIFADMKTKQMILKISIALNISIICFFVGKRVYYYATGLQIFRNDAKIEKLANIKYEKDQVNLFRAMPHDTSDIVFVGTSLTSSFLWDEMFTNSHIKNRGIKGNTMIDIINRLSEITDGKPRKIFIEAGVNDIGTDSINTILNHLIKIITTIKLKTPRTKIYVQSVLPFGITFTPKIEAYNLKVMQYCTANSITFINTYSYFLGDKSLKKELTIDGTHLNDKGYFIWCKILSPYLKN
jgi:lysophospholipase L1-like esterase